jgi:small subunit ribosomal protein S13
MAVRISGVILPPNKHIQIALQSVYGIGKHRATDICKKVGIESSVKVIELKDEQLSLIQEAVNQYEVEGDLRRRIAMDIKRLVDIKCYRGIRHKKGLPVRGQRTHTNARTRKGRRRQGGTISVKQAASK